MPEQAQDQAALMPQYELVGQKVLESLITDLNANGHTRLTIKENGDVVVNRQKKEMLKGTLDSFPAKGCWDELVVLLAEDELKGSSACLSLSTRSHPT